MSKIPPLPASKLYTSFDPNKIPWETSNDIPKSLRKDFSQPRAVKALTLALNIKDNGYNVYLAGENDLGRAYMLSQFLKPIALKKETPPDLLYVNNFENEDNPILLKVVAGQGKVLKSELAKILQQIKKEIPLRFETHAYEKKRQALLSNFQKIRESFIKEMDIIAEKQGFNLDIDEQGSLTLYPLVEGKRLSDEDFEMLDVNIRSAIKRKSDHLLHSMTAVIKKLSKAERDYKQSQKDLDKEVMVDVLHKYFTPFQEKFCSHAGIYEESVTTFFENMYKDMLENMDLFLAKETPIPLSLAELTIPTLPSQENSLSRYELNLFVDNSKLKGAPVIFESHPTFFNVLGCIERESEMGALSTNFTLIKAGSVHKANGGYLAFHIEDILAHPTAWDGLMRVLRAQKSKVEDDSNELVKTKTLSPQALDLDLKVILIGTDMMYETLLENDDRFSKLFKIKAQMSMDTERNTANIKAWLHNLANIIEEANLLPFDKSAMATLVDYSTLVCEDHTKITLKFPLIRETMIEASALAAIDNKEIVDREYIYKAYNEKMHRSAYIEELFMEEYNRDIIKIQTSGSAIGRVNGLSVTTAGQFEFGLPHQISCTVGVGHGGIIDLERESEMAGPIHTKAMMILKSYLVSQFAQNKPLVLAGSLCFEQSYNGIEGDSASGAELVALLSAISKTPINLSFAMTGAVSQAGDIMAVGGVTRKIEGFFKLCEQRGLTGKQGVIIPKDNVEHLMLNEKVRNAVENGLFNIYPVSHVTEALELLTGIPAGKHTKAGNFPKNTLFHTVDMELHELGWLAENSFKTRKKKEKSK